MTNSNYVSSLIRTWVPVVVGSIVTLAAKRYNVVIDDGTQAAAITMFTGLATAVYYAGARLLELKFPQAGWLLGLAKAPGYSSESAPPAQPAPGDNEDV